MQTFFVVNPTRGIVEPGEYASEALAFEALDVPDDRDGCFSIVVDTIVKRIDAPKGGGSPFDLIEYSVKPSFAYEGEAETIELLLGAKSPLHAARVFAAAQAALYEPDAP